VADREDTDQVPNVEDLGPDPSPLLNQAQQAEVERSQEHGLPPEIEEFGGKAGQSIRVCQTTATNYHGTGGDPEGTNPYAPFHSRTDWEVARWAKLRGPTSTAFTELLEIPDVSCRVIWIATVI